MINLKQASYKPLRITGQARCMPESEVGGLEGTIFLGVAGYVAEKETFAPEANTGIFITRQILT